jgi:tetratricopeptide (TPR) repeat protein
LWPLLERDAELAVIGELLEAARGGVGGGLLIEGPAGIGKTRLVQAAREQARACGMRVLAGRGRELERDFAFGVARELFELPLSTFNACQWAALLAGAARFAAPILGLAEAGQRTDGGTALQESLRGLYWLTANLADLGPMLIAVDDAHWADVPSLRFLIYLLSRLNELPILVVAAARPAEPQTDRSLLEALRCDPLCKVLRPGPLSHQAACRMVRAGLAGADEVFCTACHTATAGNPLLLGRLISSLQSDGVMPCADQVNAVHERVSGIAAAWVIPRLGRLPAAASALARAVAIFGSGAELRHAAALAELDSTTAAEAADMLVAAELLASGRPLEFVHPVIRQAIYDNTPMAKRFSGHVLAARLLAYDSVSAELIAAHLLVAERLGDPWVVEVLRDAAGSALAKGVPATAVTYLRRALEEPPDPAIRPEVLFELGLAQFRAAQADAFATLEQALELSTDPRMRGLIALELARALAAVRHQRTALRVLEQAVDELDDTEPDLRLRLEAELVSIARLYPSMRPLAERRLRRLRDRAQPGSLAGCLLLANLAHEKLQLESSAEQAVQLAERVVSSIGSFAGGESSLAVLFLATTVLVCADRFDLADRACEAVIEQARKSGSSLEFGSASAVRADVAYRRGAILDAEADARLADSIAREFELGEFGRRYTLAFLINALIERGELAAAAQHLESSAWT